MNCCIICVNHNSYDSLERFLKSIYMAHKNCRFDLHLNIVVVDNSIEKKKPPFFNFPSDPNIKIELFQCENLGYFPSAQLAIKELKLNLEEYKFSTISNVDVRLSSNFFNKLLSLNIDQDVAVLAPSILSSSKKLDINPKILRRPSARKLKLNSFFFRNPILHKFLVLIHLARVKIIYKNGLSNQKTSKDIYAAHGSFFIFSNNFFKNISLNFPIFLFGEELYIAELSRKNDLRIIYNNNLQVFDEENISTSQLRSSEYCRLNRIALQYILHEFY